MKKYIVLLRGINVGGKNLIPMKELSALLEESSFTEVQTYIQSGNIVLMAPQAPEQSIALLIQKRFGFTAQVVTLSEEEFGLSVVNNPYKEYQGNTVHFYYCQGKPKVNMTILESLAVDTECYELIGKVFYLHAPEGIGRSKLVAKIEACLGVSATGRNLNTVNKLQQMVKK